VPPIHMYREEVVTPWEAKGVVMRSLVEQSKGREVELVDGVKIRHGNGWVLLLPDPEVAVTHVWADAASDAEARRLVAIHAGQVAELSA